MNQQPLTGRVVVITGAARGIGFATARALKSGGATVAIGDIDESRLLEATDELGLEVSGRLDVTDLGSFEAFYAMVTDRVGPPDVLINNAGIMPIGPTLDEPGDLARRIIDINVHGVINGTKIALAAMAPRGSGHIINIASMAGEAFLPGAATYCASKAAVIGFTDAVRAEYRNSGVNVSMVLPTFTNTELVTGATGPRGFRNAEPEEIAASIVRLITRPRARVYVTRLMGGVLTAQRFIPRRVSEAMTRALGGDQMFLDGVDVSERQVYEERARKS
jgi:NAD(P)-dependent dehydrogenase (short-subunit alcohol dehydrogenase family)